MIHNHCDATKWGPRDVCKLTQIATCVFKRERVAQQLLECFLLHEQCALELDIIDGRHTDGSMNLVGSQNNCQCLLVGLSTDKNSKENVADSVCFVKRSNSKYLVGEKFMEISWEHGIDQWISNG